MHDNDAGTGEFETKNVVFELETKEIAEDGRFIGLAAAYNNVDFGRDVIRPGAFKSALAGNKLPKMLWQHNPGEIIGVWEGLQETDRGLKATGRLLTSLQRGREAHILLKEGAIDSLSIGYRVTDYTNSPTEKGTVREIKGADLFEISLVTFPMNPQALVTDVKQLQSPRDVESILRSAGVPATFAKLVASHGYEEAKSRLAKDQRDVGDADNRVQAEIAALLNEIRSLKEIFNG